MEEKTFWAMVAEFNWQENFKKSKYAIVGLKLRLAHKYPKKQMSDFRNKIGEKAEIIAGVIKEKIGKEECRRIACEYGIDFADLHDHTIGLGREFYYRAIENPWILVDSSFLRDVKTGLSFAYATPIMFHYSVFNEDYFPAQIEIFCRDILDRIANNSLSANFDESWGLIKEVVRLMRLGELEKLPRARFVHQLWLSLQRQANNFSGKEAESLRESLDRNYYLASLVKEANIVVAIRNS